jgi:hypothetical protein
MTRTWWPCSGETTPPTSWAERGSSRMLPAGSTISELPTSKREHWCCGIEERSAIELVCARFKATHSPVGGGNTCFARPVRMDRNRILDARRRRGEGPIEIVPFGGWNADDQFRRCRCQYHHGLCNRRSEGRGSATILNIETQNNGGKFLN